MVASSAVGNRAPGGAGLELTGAIGGARAYGVMTGCGGMPLVGPEDPGILRERRGKLRLLPGLTIIGADLDLLDTAVAGEGQATNLDL